MLGSLFSLASLVFMGASAQGTTPAPGPQATPSPLSAQLDHGDLEYRLVCSACHAYDGEGLTAAWLRTWAPPDQNCWQSKCHALNHPPDGFVLPHFVPAIAGPGTLEQMRTAQDLFAFIHFAMPFQDPGYLSTQDYWDITAHLLVLNNIQVGPDPIGPTNASLIALHRDVVPSPRLAPGQERPPHPATAGLSLSWTFGGATFVLIVLAIAVGLVSGASPSEDHGR